MIHEYSSFNIAHSFIAVCKTYAQFDFKKDRPSTCISWPTGIDIRNMLYTLVNFSGPYGIWFIIGYLALATHTEPVSVTAEDVEFARRTIPMT